MHSLRQLVLDYLYRIQSSGLVAGDPDWLSKLASSAIDDLSDGYNTLTSPVAPWTSEARTTLLGGDFQGQGTQRIPIVFPGPVLVVGVRPVVIPVFPIPAGTVAAVVDDIDVQMDINLQTQLNATFGQTGAVGNPQGNQFTSLGAIGIQTPRLFGAALKDPRPDLGFTFRWTQSPPAPPGQQIHPDTIIKVSVYYIPLNPRESANVAPSMRNAP